MQSDLCWGDNESAISERADREMMHSPCKNVGSALFMKSADTVAKYSVLEPLFMYIQSSYKTIQNGRIN